jgi:hypothetical protein
MANGSILPPDIRAEMEKKKAPGGTAVSPGGIGGRARANAATAHQREVAMGRAPEDDDAPEKPAPEQPEEKEEHRCPNPRCSIKAEPGWFFCPNCGTDLVAEGASKRLGIELTDADVQDYLFKGYIVRDIKILGKHTATLRSSQAKDLKAIDNYIINGDWGKDEKGQEKQLSDFLLRQMNALCLTAMAVQKIDGQSIGETLKDRVAWMEERGSAFVDILAQRVTLFNRAITEYLKREDSLLGS